MPGVAAAAVTGAVVWFASKAAGSKKADKLIALDPTTKIPFVLAKKEA